MKKIYFLILFSAATAISFGQTTTEKKTTISERDKKKQERKDKINKLIKEEEEGALIYSKQSAFGFKINTDGWGTFYEHGKYKTIKTTNLWWLEFGERKSAKEEKVTIGQLVGNFVLVGNPYIFGKQNNFYYLKAGVGQQKLIGGKGNKNGVAVSAIYGGGIAMGYLKPYYLNINDLNDNNIDVKYIDADSSTKASFLDPSVINGASGFTKGFGEGTFVPGAYGRLALRFDYGRFNEFLSAFEVGVHAEFYSKKMPIMINNPEKQFFFNGYIAIEFGTRK